MPYSLKDTINNLSINDLKNNFFNRDEFHLDDIILFYTLKDSEIKKSTIQWRVSRLLKLGIIQRTGRGKYALGNFQKFTPYPTPNIKKVHQIIMQKCSMLNTAFGLHNGWNPFCLILPHNTLLLLK